MSLLQSFIDKNQVKVSQISFIEPFASFHDIGLKIMFLGVINHGMSLSVL
jgi:hypothetical protein